VSDPMKQFLERASSDPAFAKAVLERPQTLFEKLDLPAPPEGVELKAVQNDSNTFHLVMPPPPPDVHVADEVLVAVAGGTGCNETDYTSSFSCFPSCAGSFRLCH